MCFTVETKYIHVIWADGTSKKVVKESIYSLDVFRLEYGVEYGFYYDCRQFILRILE